MMKNVLVINGHEYYDFAKGELNKTMFDEIVQTLDGAYEVKTTVIDAGYDIKEEQEKYKWADVVIYQTPIYWFSLPAKFKKYMDEVYEYGVFFVGAAEGYGKGGLMKGKKYMFSTTWNAPVTEYKNVEGFFAGKDFEDSIAHLHYAQQFIGMEPLKSFGAHDVIANPDITLYKRELQAHLEDVFEMTANQS